MRFGRIGVPGKEDGLSYKKDEIDTV